MKTKTVKVEVPEVLIDAVDWVHQKYAWARWRISGPRCAETGELLFSKNYDIVSEAQGQRVMFTHHSKDALSIEGVRLRINRYFYAALGAGETEKEKCDCCGGKDLDTVNIIWAEDAKKHGVDIDIRFGMAWWNGFHLCIDCIDEALSNHKARDSFGVLTYHKGKVTVTNRQGYRKEVNGL